MAFFRTISVICFLFAATTLASFAMSVSPIVLDLETTGTGSTGAIAVTNPSETNMPVEITVSEIEIDQTGAIIATANASDDFLILPPLASIPAGATQNFRIQYLGEPDLLQGRLFQFNVDQVPVNLEDTSTAKLQIVYSITGLISLAVSSEPAHLTISDTAIVEDEDLVRKAAITVENHGNNYAYFSRGSLNVRLVSEDGRTKWRESLSPNRIEKEIGFGLVPPGKSRTVILPYALPEDEGEIRADFNAEQRR